MKTITAACAARWAGALALALLVQSWRILPAHAETTVPLPIQVELFRRVVRFERGLSAHSPNHLKITIVFRPGDSRSEAAAARLFEAFAATKDPDDEPVSVSIYPFSTAAALRKVVDKWQVVYLATGLDRYITDIADALRGLPALTVATDGEYVELGAVVGFDLVSAHPKIAINLGRAQFQGLDFDSDLFRFARVVGAPGKGPGNGS